MKAKEIGDSFSTQKFSIDVSGAGINAEKIPEGNFGCFWTVQFWLLFSNLASKIYFETQALYDKDHVSPHYVFKINFTGKF